MFFIVIFWFYYGIDNDKSKREFSRPLFSLNEEISEIPREGREPSCPYITLHRNDFVRHRRQLTLNRCQTIQGHGAGEIHPWSKLDHAGGSRARKDKSGYGSKMAAHGSVGASANAVGSLSDQSGTRLNRVRAVTRPRQLPRRRESARHGRGPAIEMRLAAGRQLPVDLCPVRSSPRAFFFLSLSTSSHPLRFLCSCLETRTHAFPRHGDEKVNGGRGRIRVLNTCGSSAVSVPFSWFWKLLEYIGF